MQWIHWNWLTESNRYMSNSTKDYRTIDVKCSSGSCYRNPLDHVIGSMGSLICWADFGKKCLSFSENLQFSTLEIISKMFYGKSQTFILLYFLLISLFYFYSYIVISYNIGYFLKKTRCVLNLWTNKCWLDCWNL